MSDTPTATPTATAVESIQTDPTVVPTERTDLNDLEAQVLARFEQQSTDADQTPPGDLDPATEQVGAGGDDGTGKPVDPPAPAQEPGQLPPADPGTGAPAGPPPEVPPPGPGDYEIQLTPEDRFAQMTQEQRESALQVADWAAGLDDTAMQTVDAALSGDYVLVPLSDLPAIQRFYQAQQASPTAPAAPPAYQANPNPQGLPPDPRWAEPPLFGSDPDDPLANDPRFQQMQQTVQQLAEQQQREQEAQALAWTRGEIESGAAAWWASPANADLTAEDRARIEDAVVKTGAYAAQAAVHDPRTAITMAFQDVVAKDETLRQRRIDREVAERLEAERAGLYQQQQRNAGTTALAGSSAPPSGMQAPPMDPDQALVNDIARALQGQNGN